jgi:glycosyltransferase involved in cell wall biosynthesis
MKKLLFLSNEGSITGAPLFLYKLVKHLKIERPEYRAVIFFAKNGELINQFLQEGFEVVVSEKKSISPTILQKTWKRFTHYFRFIWLLVTYRPDMVYSNTIVNFGEVVIASLFRVPVLLHIHEGKNFAQQYRYSLKISCFFVDNIIVGSQYVNGVLNSIARKSGIVIYNGVLLPNDFYVKKRNIGIPVKLGILGTINSNKGQLVAIEAMRTLEERGVSVSLTIAGTVEDEVYFEKIVEFLNQNSLNDCVKFIGLVPNAEAFISTLDILLVPSFDEALPTVILEAFSVGTPVVASDVGGIPEMIENEINGFLFQAGESQMLANYLEQIISNYGFLESISVSAIEVLKNKFDLNSNNNEIKKCLDEMLASKCK